MSTPDNELTELEIKLGNAMSAVLQVQEENNRFREALKEIKGLKLPDFMGPHDMALECKQKARAALEGKTE